MPDTIYRRAVETEISCAWKWTCLCFCEAVSTGLGMGAESIKSGVDLCLGFVVTTGAHSLQIIPEVGCCHPELRVGAKVPEGCSVILIAAQLPAILMLPVPQSGSFSTLLPPPSSPMLFLVSR